MLIRSFSGLTSPLLEVSLGQMYTCTPTILISFNSLNFVTLLVIPLLLYTCSQFADHHDISHFYEVSAKTGENVTESFEAFFREVHRKVGILYLS